MGLNRFREDGDKIMEYIHKLPFLLGAAAAIIVGVGCNFSSVGHQDTYMRMAVAMIIFFAIGVYLRNTLQKINDELETKKLEKENIIRTELEEAKKAEAERALQELNQRISGSTIDLKVDDTGEDFSPLTVSEYIRSDK